MQGRQWTKKELDELTYEVIGCAIEVHRFFGPGLLEENYEDCLAAEFEIQGIGFERQKKQQVIYKDKLMPNHYRLDLLVENILIIELKAVKDLSAVHKAQIMTYLKLAGKPKGLLINFNTKFLSRGKSWYSFVNEVYQSLPE